MEIAEADSKQSHSSALAEPEAELRIWSYPWYISDWLQSETRAEMSMAERGVYRDLLDLCWANGSLPTDENTLSNMCEVSDLDAFREVFSVVRKRFIERDGRLHHQKVDVKRKLLIDHKKERSLAGRAGGLAKARNKRNMDAAKARPKQSFSSSTSSATAEPQQSHASARAEPQISSTNTPSPTPSLKNTSTEEYCESSVVFPDARANGNGAGGHTSQTVVRLPDRNTDPQFAELIGAFLSLGVAISDDDHQRCWGYWLALDLAGKIKARAVAVENARGEWATREGAFVPRPWNYLREKHWEREAVMPERKRPMSKMESALRVGRAEFLREKGAK